MYGSADESLHAAPAPCCAQREDCKTSVNSENLHVSLVTAVFRELQLDFSNISSNNLTTNIGSDNRSYCSTKIPRISHADVWMRTGLKIIALFAGNEPISGEACDKEEEIMASRVDVGCTKSPKSIKMVFLVF